MLRLLSLLFILLLLILLLRIMLLITVNNNFITLIILINKTMLLFLSEISYFSSPLFPSPSRPLPSVLPSLIPFRILERRVSSCQRVPYLISSPTPLYFLFLGCLPGHPVFLISRRPLRLSLPFCYFLRVSLPFCYSLWLSPRSQTLEILLRLVLNRLNAEENGAEVGMLSYLFIY